MVLITGGSKGIGYELARLFAKDHQDLILVSRSAEALESASTSIKKDCPVNIWTIPLDLSIKDSPERLFETVKESGMHVDVLVNNAGFGDVGPFLESDPDKRNGIIDLNISALVEITRLFADEMKENGGKILNVSSVAAFLPGPNSSVYYASKAFVQSFSEALREELKPYGISVCSLCPGPVDTGFFYRAISDPEKAKAISDRGMSPAAVARYGYARFKKGKAVSIPGWPFRFGVFLLRFAPRSLARKISGRIQKQRK